MKTNKRCLSSTAHDVDGQAVWAARFAALAKRAAWAAGRPATFALVIIFVCLWAVSGFFFNFSDSWQLVLNTFCNIATILIVCLIQNTQNRDMTAIQVKLDELIRATQGAHNVLVNLEEVEDTMLAEFRENYRGLAAKARENLRQGRQDTESPDLEPKS